MKMTLNLASGFRTVAALAFLTAAPAYGTTIASCISATLSNCSGSTDTLTLALSNQGGQSATWNNNLTTLPSNAATTPFTLGDFATTVTSANSGASAPANFWLWITVGGTQLAAFNATITNVSALNGTITDTVTFSGNSSSGWVAGTSGSYATETNSALGITVDIAQTTTFNSSSISPKTTNISAEVITATPEPATFGFAAFGGVALLFAARRYKFVK